MTPKCRAFTLAEVLITLFLIGLIAALVIPKILHNTSNSQNLSRVKDTVSAFSAAFYALKREGLVTPQTTFEDVMSRVNTLQRLPVASTVDQPNNVQGVGTFMGCGNPCFAMPNGSVIVANPFTRFSSNPNEPAISQKAIVFIIDPDGKQSSIQNSVGFVMYFDGTLRSYATTKSNTEFTWGMPEPGILVGFNTILPSPQSLADPPWFRW